MAKHHLLALRAIINQSMRPSILDPHFKLGVLGGGQLGKMLCEAASPWTLQVWILDKDPSFPAAPLASRFVEGDFSNYDDVLAFGRQVDVLTIEIESVNIEALEQLEKEGKPVYPTPRALRIIRDKGIQKVFYRNHQFPTSPFELYDSPASILAAIKAGTRSLPFVQKARTGGYDGRGVAVIRTEQDLDKLLPGPSLVEELVDIEMELAVIVANNGQGQYCSFATVEMSFHPTANLVEFLLAPARISLEQYTEAQEIALQLAKAMQVQGLLAVELFLAKDGQILINEVAPRPHNSGHHTIDSCVCSQFEQHLRAVLGLPLGDTSLLSPAVMINVLGAEGHSGPVHYEGLEDILAIPGVCPHIYGKNETRPFRKMGHVTVVAPTDEAAIERAREVQKTLKVISHV